MTIRSSQLVLLIGLQGAGKSTFYRANFAETHVLVSRDLLRNNKNPARRQRQLIEEALQEGYSVVIDNTNPTPEVRAELIQVGHSYDAEIMGYFFVPNVKESLKRNRQREGKARVPDVAIYVTAKKLVAPTHAEGFDQLFSVRARNDGTFSVQILD
jgi:predicted kinase